MPLPTAATGFQNLGCRSVHIFPIPIRYLYCNINIHIIHIWYIIDIFYIFNFPKDLCTFQVILLQGLTTAKKKQQQQQQHFHPILARIGPLQALSLKQLIVLICLLDLKMLDVKTVISCITSRHCPSTSPTMPSSLVLRCWMCWMVKACRWVWYHPTQFGIPTTTLFCFALYLRFSVSVLQLAICMLSLF